MSRFIRYALLVSVTVALTSGCASLRVFTSTHTHKYEGRKVTKQIVELEKRVERLEQSRRKSGRH